MPECDDCGATVSEVWRHSERSESMTHRTISWTCRDCNPDVDRPIAPLTGATVGSRGSNGRQPSD